MVTGRAFTALLTCDAWGKLWKEKRSISKIHDLDGKNRDRTLLLFIVWSGHIYYLDCASGVERETHTATQLKELSDVMWRVFRT